MPTLKYDKVEWENFCRIWAGHAKGFDKYFDLESLVEYYQPIFKDLNLGPVIETNEDRVVGILSILDISTGFGVFPTMCQQMGHHVRITDIINDYSAVLIEAQKVLGLPACINYDFHTDKGNSLGNLFPGNPENKKEKRFGYIPIPQEFKEYKFDLITAFASSPMSYFDETDWYMFLHDCKIHLAHRGAVCLLPNKSKGYDVLEDICRNLIVPPKPCRHGWIIDRELIP